MLKLNYNDKENTILDASMKLFVLYGYDKTTVSEIAKEAGISKGAIYLHFQSKVELFENLLFRESKRYYLKWFELIEADPKGGLISGMYKNMLYALTGSELMTAIFKKDSRILGSYLKIPNSFFRTEDNRSMRSDFVKMMQDVGSIRQELNPGVTAHIMDILGLGLVSMGEFKAPEDIPPTAEIIEAIADFMDRALTPDDGGNSEAGKQIIRKLAEETIKQYENQKITS